jgi:hypothetical protein
MLTGYGLIQTVYCGIIGGVRKEAARLADAMRAVETVIRLFDSAYDVRRIAVRRRQRLALRFKRGTMFRTVFDVLKKPRWGH